MGDGCLIEEATGPLETGSKGVLEPCFFKSKKGSNTFNSPFQKCLSRQKTTLEFILKGSGESYLCIAFVGFQNTGEGRCCWSAVNSALTH